MPISPADAAAISSATTVLEVADVVRHVARTATAADGATFVVRDGEKVFYVEEDAMAPLWKGQRFPLDRCISGWAMTHGESAVVPDIETDRRIPLEAYLPTFVRSLVMVPVGVPRASAALGAYWAARHEATPAELKALTEVAGLTAEALDRVGLDAAPWAPNFGDR